MSLKKIIIIITYYGKFPWYANYFFHSCKFNPSIDFLIITDNEKPLNLSENIKFENIELEQISKIAAKKLNLLINIKTPYKLCDFKPAYGFLFNNYIKEYDFWGHGDLDVIYGNIRNFITDDILNNNDIITINEYFLSGAFTLFKNTKKTNELFFQSRDFKKVFTEDRNFSFDETNGVFIPLFEGKPISCINTEIESMTHVVKKLQKIGFINAYFNTHILEGLPGKILWINGILIYKKKIEIMMFHLIMYKHVFNPARVKKNIPNSFSINAVKKLMYTPNKSV